MERTLISWSVPNMITIWLMLAIGFLTMSIAVQVGTRWLGSSQPANNAAGY